ncbi:ATP-binding protein [Thermosipho sp. 1063]|uniref:ATP-binding protein n=1 Tax=unclassified Thermosipho (in: thermotogales) TaxID=2676525 RepID=UPI00350F4EBE
MFIENNENILFVGTSGFGKTHLAVSLRIEKYRYSTYFIHFQELIAQLKKNSKRK